jgi:Flp pilus assembly protein TadD
MEDVDPVCRYALRVLAGAASWGADVPQTEKIQLSKTQESKGDSARIHNNNSEAVYYYRSALHINSQNSVLLNKLGVAELQTGDRSAARKHFNQAVKYDYRNVPAWNNLGVLSCLERKYSASVRYLKNALALRETNASAHLNMAEACGLDWAGWTRNDRARASPELDADILS